MPISRLGISRFVRSVSEPETPKPPAAPASLGSVPGSITQTSVQLTWPAAVVPAGGPAVDFYYVFRDGAQVLTVPATNRTPVMTGLTPGTSYTWGVRAHSPSALGGTSPMSSLYTMQTVAAGGAPGAPTAGTPHTILNTGMTVPFTPGTSDPVNATQGYRLYVNGGSTHIMQVAANATSFVVTGLAPATLYSFTVKAFNTVSGVLTLSENSNTVSATTTGTVAPSALPYKSTSFYKSKLIGTNPPIDAARTSGFKAFMKLARAGETQHQVNWPVITINTNWSMSYHVHKVGQSAPIWKLAGGNTGDAKLRILQTQGFHMPDSLTSTFPTGTQDRPGVMIDYEFGYTLQFADAVPNQSTRTITVSNAGIMWHGSNGLDYRNPRSDDQRNFTSRGRIIDAMVIRRDILDQAIINNTSLGHVLHIFFVENWTPDGFVHPMVGAEGGGDGWGAEGERFAISPTVNLAARGLTGAALVVAKTMQEYGCYIGDNSGSVSRLKAAQPQFYVGTNLTENCLQGKVFWDDMVVIQRGWPG